ncbi:hypothetical protein BGZ65_008405 [Modicella reniformis]|uniref:Uncharacterized protein n=1 Tax=Modicella reniformis TaxID=1440133 RepID=A0A9P6IU31_9FUNG|nr:hypothetical protein BGZ65_008405 [Modicella reniformis]
MISQQRHLRKLRIGSPSEKSRSVGCDLMALLVALQDCPRLSCLHIEGIVEDEGQSARRESAEQAAAEQRYSSSSTSTAHQQQQQQQQQWTDQPTTLGKWAQKLISRSKSSNNRSSNNNNYKRSIKQQQPWRKFAHDSTIKLPSKIPEKLLSHQLDDSKLYSALTRLCISRLTISSSSSSSSSSQKISLAPLFTKTPNLQELDMDFESLPPDHIRECLEAMTNHCYQLETLVIQASDPILPSPDEWTTRLDMFLDPWTCYETIRHVDQRNCIVDRDSLEAFFGRLALMRRLVSLSISLDDMRQLLAFTSSTSSATTEEEDEEEQQQQQQQERNDNNNNNNNNSCSCSNSSIQSIQELTFAPIQVQQVSRLLLSRPLDATDMAKILKTFTSLRKIRYEGRVFPLDQGAREYLNISNLRKHISIMHTSQLPPSVM